MARGPSNPRAKKYVSQAQSGVQVANSATVEKYALMVNELAKHYYDDPVGFAYDVLGETVSQQQADYFMAVAGKKKKRTVVTSGHGTGKTRGMAILIWWFLLTRMCSNVLCIAPTKHQLFDLLWKYVSELHRKLPVAYAQMFEIQSDEIFHKAFRLEWGCKARTARKDVPEGLQGFHGKHLLILCDEGCGIADKIFETIEGALTEEDNHLFIATNPTRTGGYVYRATKDSADFNYFKLSSLDSPFYDKSHAESLARRYGETSNVYKVRVLGEFPDSEPDQLIPTDAIEEAYGLEVSIKRPVVWALDVARMGDDECVLARRHGMDILPLIPWSKVRTDQTVRKIIKLYNSTPKDERPDRIVIDCNGLGVGVYDQLLSRNFPVVEFVSNWASSDPNRWENAKAELYDEVAELIKKRRVHLPRYTYDGNHDVETEAQLGELKYAVDEKTGVFKIIGKKTMKSKYGFDSPDRAEAIIYTFWEREAEGSGEDEEEYGRVKQSSAYEYDEFNTGGSHDSQDDGRRSGRIVFQQRAERRSHHVRGALRRRRSGHGIRCRPVAARRAGCHHPHGCLGQEQNLLGWPAQGGCC